jgi:hypothetical protein
MSIKIILIFRLRVLNPLALGGLTYTMWFGSGVLGGVYLAYLWKTWSFNRKSVGVLAALLVIQRGFIDHIPNYFCEVCK